MFPNTQEPDTLSPIGQSPKGYHMAEWDNIKTLPLARELESKADPQHFASVIGLIDHAAPLLDRIIETFPTYTLHDRTHSQNVLRLMGRLLGPRCSSLTALESAMLILAAYFHDIGMVFNKDQRQSLKDEPEFPQFLHQHPEARLAMTQNQDQIPEEIAEWYCRHRHADRVILFLNELDKDNRLNWGRVSLKDALALVCRSHNFDARELTASSFDTSSLAQCDLRFCSILLRLADILDFDHTRSPEPVYKHLGLPTPEAGPEQTSADEWRKHFSSDGFKFPPVPPIPYVLPFVAGPDDPNVEHDIRQFLDAIETEIATCHRLLDQCSQRWQDLLLPARIDRQIVSKGYTFGEFRFTLDQQQILALFTGENLYDNPYVFIRELLQNAIDTSRFREYFEHGQGRKDFKASPIVVTGFTDADGYSWVRFDDFGMGMDQRIIENYLLRVGKSYYESPEFQADKINCQAATGRDFTPISRFGIGLLSCFLAGDRIEISTLHLADSGQAKPIRLSIPGLTGYFVLQTPDNDPADMPSETGPAPGYRRLPGTSIAVRFDPTKEAEPFDLKAQLEKHLLCPPVPVHHQGHPIGGDLASWLGKQWTHPVSVTLTPDERGKIPHTADPALPKRVAVEFFPLNLTAASPSSDLAGQIVLVSIRGYGKPRDEVPDRDYDRPFVVCLDMDGKPVLHFAEAPHYAAPEMSLDRVLEELLSPMAKAFTRALAGPWLSHNGIAVHTPCRNDTELAAGRPLVPSRPNILVARGVCVIWLVALADTLRPNLPLARDQVRSFPWVFYSAINLALLRATHRAGWGIPLESPLNIFNDLLPNELFVLDDMLHDSLLCSPGGWLGEPVIRAEGRTVSVKGLLKALYTSQKRGIRLLEPLLPISPQPRFARAPWTFSYYCWAALLQMNVNVILRRDGGHLDYVALPGLPRTLDEAAKLFPPLFFVPYTASTLFATRRNSSVNPNHPLGHWLLDNATQLAREHPDAFRRLRHCLITGHIWHFTTSVNAVLHSLRTGPHPIPVPDSVFLKEEDFGW